MKALLFLVAVSLNAATHPIVGIFPLSGVSIARVEAAVKPLPVIVGKSFATAPGKMTGVVIVQHSQSNSPNSATIGAALTKAGIAFKIVKVGPPSRHQEWYTNGITTDDYVIFVGK